MHVDAFGQKCSPNGWQESRRSISMHQQCFCGVAHCRVLGFAIDHHCYSRLHVRSRVHVDVADPIGMSHHWNRCRALYVLHELIRSAWNDQIDVFVHAHQLGHSCAALDEIDAIRWEFHAVQCNRGDGRSHRSHERSVGTGSLRPSLEDHCICRLDPEGGNLYRCVGARLKDHAHYA